MPRPDPVLALEGLGKSFGATHALRDVSLTLHSGEAHGLVGHNGAGKSTLIKIVAGVHQPDIGTISVQGVRVDINAPVDAYNAGIRVIHQDAPLVGDFDTVDNCYLGRPYPRRWGMVDKSAMRAAVAAIAKEIAPDLPIDRAVALLNTSQRQFVRLVRALLDNGRILVLDEPTAALSAEESQRFFDVLEKVRARGTAIVLVTHRLDEIAAVCSRATVLVDGAVSGRFEGSDLTAGALVSAMGGSESPEAKTPDRTPTSTVLELGQIKAGGLAAPTSLSLQSGEIVALYGLVGSGRSDLLNAIWGSEKLASGTMTIEGTPYRPRSPIDAVRRGVSYVPSDRHRTGLFENKSLLFNATLPLLRRFRMADWLPVPNRQRERKAFVDAARSVGLVYHSADQLARTLSGGNQQKLIFSRWAHRRSKVMLLDEPTEGVDIVAKAALRKIIRDMAKDGNGVLVSTSDRDEALALGDRILVFRLGTIVADIPRSQATPTALSTAAQSMEIVAA